MNQQSLREDEPSTAQVIGKQISYLASEDDKKRRQALEYLAGLPIAELCDAIQVQRILPRVLQLTLVVNDQVRREAVILLRSIPLKLAAEYVEQMLPFVCAGLTHLAANVATTSLELLDWLNKTCGEQLVSCRGGWVKTLQCFLVMLRWTSEPRTSGWVTTRSSIGDLTYQASSLIRCLQVLASFLEIGLRRPYEDRAEIPNFPLAGTLGPLLPTTKAKTFSCLGLYGELAGNENSECNDVDTRKRVLEEKFQPALEQGLAALLQDGGFVGAAAREAAEILQMGMSDSLGYDAWNSGDGFGDLGEDDAQSKGKGKSP